MRKDLILIFCVALVVRLLFSIIVAGRVGGEAFEPTRRDADFTQYIELAKSIMRDSTFTLYGVPHSFRTPGYPAWLAFWYWVSGSWFFSVAVVGSVLGALTAVITYQAGRLLFSRKVALCAAWLFALEPYGIHMASRPMTESLYTLLMALFAFAIIHIYRATTLAFRPMAIVGILVGLATLVRPQMWPFFIPLFALVVFLLLRQAYGVRGAFFAASVFVISTLAVVSPWVLRNNIRFGKADISSQGGWNLYLYDVKRFTDSDRYYGKTEAELKQFVKERLGREGPEDIRSIVYQPVYYREAFRIIFAHPVRYALWHIKEGLIFLHDDGIRDMLRHVGYGTDSGITEIGFSGLAGFALLLAVVAGNIFWISLFALAAYGIWHSYSEPKLFSILILFAISILYVPLVAGTLAVARFRFPMTPMIFILAVAGFQSYFGKTLVEKESAR